MVAVGSYEPTATDTSGSVKWNELPRPSVLSTQIRPPCAAMTPFAMYRPSPVPSCPFAVVK